MQLWVSSQFTCAVYFFVILILQCSHWCTPALQILQSRVDKVGAVAKEIMLPNVSVVVPKIPDEPVLETVNISEAELNDFV